MMDFVERIGRINKNGRIKDLYFELNKWSFESKFILFLSFCDRICLKKFEIQQILYNFL